MDSVSATTVKKPSHPPSASVVTSNIFCKTAIYNDEGNYLGRVSGLEKVTEKIYCLYIGDNEPAIREKAALLLEQLINYLQPNQILMLRPRGQINDEAIQGLTKSLVINELKNPNNKNLKIDLWFKRMTNLSEPNITADGLNYLIPVAKSGKIGCFTLNGYDINHASVEAGIISLVKELVEHGADTLREINISECEVSEALAKQIVQCVSESKLDIRLVLTSNGLSPSAENELSAIWVNKGKAPEKLLVSL